MKRIATFITACMLALSIKAQNNNCFVSFVNNGQRFGLNDATGIKASASIKDSNNLLQTIICMFVNPTTNDTLIISAKDEGGFSPGEQHIFSAKSSLLFYYKTGAKGLFIKMMDNTKREITPGNYLNISKLENKPGGLLEGSFAFTDIAFENNNDQVVARLKAIKDGRFKTVVSSENLFGNKTNNAANNSNTKSSKLAETRSQLFETLDPSYVIKKIFKPVGRNADGFFRWIPLSKNSADSNLISDDGYAYTKYYTALNYKDSVEKHILFFYSAVYQKGQMLQCINCPVPISCASFIKQQSGYFLNKIDTFIDYNGEGGEPAINKNSIELNKIGVSKYAIAMYNYQNFSGQQNGQVAYYEPENFKQIFSTDILDDNSWEGRSKTHSNKTIIKFLPVSNSEDYSLKAITTGTIETQSGKIIPVNKEELYYYDKKKQQYILKAKPLLNK